jgi:hypothetical protein
MMSSEICITTNEFLHSARENRARVFNDKIPSECPFPFKGKVRMGMGVIIREESIKLNQ